MEEDKVDVNTGVEEDVDSGDLNLTMVSKTPIGSKLESAHYALISQITVDGRIILANEFEVFPNKEVPEFASPGTKAYEGRNINSSAKCIVLICGRSLLPRVSSIGSYRNINNKNILKLFSAGIIDWPLENRQRFALVFARPQGKKILVSADSEISNVSGDKLIPMVVEPALKVLENLKNIDLIHGAISLDNIFLTGSLGSDSVIIGECLSSAPSLFLNPMYETITRAMAMSSGRGVGTSQDDLYSLGICVAMMARRKNLLLGKSEEKIIADKLEHGTYGSIVGKEKLPTGIGEFLRGVLQDDIEMRWTLEDCFKWLEKRRIAPKQGAKIFRAARPFIFKGEKYVELRGLADAFSKNINEAAEEAEGSDFLMWLRRNFEEKELSIRFEKAKDREKANTPERFVHAICVAMDPYGPVRYKHLSLFPMGFGSALSMAIHDDEGLQPYADLISQQMFSIWINQIFDYLPEASPTLAMLEKCRMALNQRIMGYGMERVLYIANRGLACMSPYFDNYYVLVPSALLNALEKISDSPTKPDMVLDRHMMAFLSVREPNLIDPYIGYLNSGDRGRQVIGVARVLGGIQRRFTVGPVPGISRWVASLLAPSIENFNDRDLRQEMTRVMNKIQGNGDLVDIINLVDDSRVVQEDSRRFNIARKEYAALRQEKVMIDRYLKLKRSFGRASGRQAAMIVSSFVAIIIIALYSFVHLYSKLGS